MWYFPSVVMTCAAVPGNVPQVKESKDTILISPT